MGKHYTKEELELYRNHQMSVLGRIGCSSHLAECPECKKLLQELEEDDKLLQKLKDSVRLYENLLKNDGKPPQRSRSSAAGM